MSYGLSYSLTQSRSLYIVVLLNFSRVAIPILSWRLPHPAVPPSACGALWRASLALLSSLLVLSKVILHVGSGQMNASVGYYGKHMMFARESAIMVPSAKSPTFSLYGVVRASCSKTRWCDGSHSIVSGATFRVPDMVPVIQTRSIILVLDNRFMPWYYAGVHYDEFYNANVQTWHHPRTESPSLTYNTATSPKNSARLALELARWKVNLVQRVTPRSKS